MSGVFKDGAYCPLGRAEDMSEGEYQTMWELCNGSHEAPPPSLAEPRGWWRTKGGISVMLVEMSSAHLLNTIRLFDRAGWGEHPKIRELSDELGRRRR